MEIKSEHFRLWTDDSLERGRRLVRDLERRREVIASAMGAPPSPATALVMSVRNARERAVYVPIEFIGAAWGPHNPTGQAGILIAADHNDPRDHVVSHELAHVVSLGWFANLPPWLSEGIATYFEMVDVDSDETSVTIGTLAPGRAATLRGRLIPTVADLFACLDQRCKDAAFYAGSWAMFTLLLNEHYDGLARYLQRLNQLPRDAEDTRWEGEASELPPDQQARARARWIEQSNRDRSAAWHDAFPDLPLEKLDAELTEWLRTGKLRLPRVDITVREFPTEVRMLGDADVLAARSWLGYWFTSDKTTALRDAEAALALDRSNVLAQIVATALTHAISPEAARRTAAAHPDDWRALRLVARAVHGTDEAIRALRRLCSIAGGAAPECRPPRPPRTLEDR